ncbi:THAP domain-containing protein 6-like isoform X2 [Protopterus annectens]|uniref:THAP domain-containing protein 6-like isoform X2 n=1 Tax=Protopterus annectens TaxID=7888 RepID=UPI001CFA6D38|nr:THAP domain-containing protein 6-like isoform X2 [Protopterus annectens]
MVFACCAYNCKNRQVAEVKNKGVTFHRSEDFDRTGQTVRLRQNVVPSVFQFPSHLQSRPVKMRNSFTSRRALEIDTAVSAKKESSCNTVNAVTLDHSYVIRDSPRQLKQKIDGLMEVVERLQRQLHNATRREKRLRQSMISTMDHSKVKELITDMQNLSDLEMSPSSKPLHYDADDLYEADEARTPLEIVMVAEEEQISRLWQDVVPLECDIREQWAVTLVDPNNLETSGTGIQEAT